MIRSLYTAASGMQANQLLVDTISNNLSNVNTTGFKKAKLQFQDLLYQTLVEPGATNSDGIKLPGSLQVGLGVKAQSNDRIFLQGNLQQTGNELDLAIEGDGLFQVQRADGTIGYTRDGTFKINADGIIVNAQGNPLVPNINVPDQSSHIAIGPEGTVSVTRQGDTEPTEIGTIELARFPNPSGLRSLGGNLYSQTEASGSPLVSNPAEGGAGTIAQKYIETSNVQLVEEMVNLIVAQRAYEINSKAVTTSDQMLQNANNLKN
ncbi:MAG: flagellar basal-body rod protein FlgG [Fibrobacterota bacterium]|jgi:flagellar basal-body rod protein FlgG